MAYTWILALTFLCGISNAYFTNVRPPYYSPPRYESCKESIEDLRALVEITQCLKPEPCVCPVCTTSLSEEVIIKLVNALIYTVTHTCGLNGKGIGGMPGGENTGGGNTGGGNTGGGNTGSGNTGGGNTGGGNTGGGNTGGGNTGGGNTGGGNTGGGNTGGGNAGGGNTGGGNTGGGNTGGGNNGGKDPLIKKKSDGDVLSVNVADQKVVGVGIGTQRTDNALLGVNLLPGDGTIADVSLLNKGNSENRGGRSTSSTPSGGSNNPTDKTQPTTSINQPTASTQTSNSSGNNNSATGNTTGAAGNQNVLSGNSGNVALLNNTMINQVAASSSNLIKNLTATTT